MAASGADTSDGVQTNGIAVWWSHLSRGLFAMACLVLLRMDFSFQAVWIRFSDLTTIDLR